MTSRNQSRVRAYPVGVMVGLRFFVFHYQNLTTTSLSKDTSLVKKICEAPISFFSMTLIDRQRVRDRRGGNFTE